MAPPPSDTMDEIYAGLAELADALALGASGRKAVQVQVLCPAPILAKAVYQIRFVTVVCEELSPKALRKS